MASLAAKILGGALTIGSLAYLATELTLAKTTPFIPNSYNDPITTTFPSDLPQTQNNDAGIVFQFYNYSRPSVLNPPNLISVGNVVLPLPGNLVDQQQLEWSQENFSTNPALGGALDAVAGKATFADKAIEGAQAIAAGLGTTVATVASIGNLNKILQMGGLVQNPFLTILFNAPAFKRHTFTWTFIPENPKDAAILRFITNKFRYHELPDISGGGTGLLLTYPDMVKPFIIPSGFMYDFKYCVIESSRINYAPGATPGFQAKTLAPSAIEFTVSLLEIEYWLKRDIVSPIYMNGDQPYHIGGIGAQ